MKVVLIADDDPSMLRLISATVASNQYQIVQATNGDEAWALLTQHRPTVAVLDVQMPGRSGLELCRSIRADFDLAQTYVILVSANAQRGDVEDGCAAGADQYLTKPFSPTVLRTSIQEALGPS